MSLHWGRLQWIFVSQTQSNDEWLGQKAAYEVRITNAELAMNEGIEALVRDKSIRVSKY